MQSHVRKGISTAGMLLVGDAVAYLLGPRKHVRVWQWPGGPGWYQEIEALGENRRVGVPFAGLELALGLALIRYAQSA